MDTVKTHDGIELDAAQLLAELHNGTRPVGLGRLHDLGRDMTREEAAKVIAEHHGFRFDYVCGRPLKVGTDDEGVIYRHSEDLYDSNAFDGAFRLAVARTINAGGLR